MGGPSDNSSKRPGRALFLIGGVLAGTLLAFYLWTEPPNDEQVIREAHRDSFEQLRDMLKADTQVVRVADWGLETTNAPGIAKPPQGRLPVDRYDKYLLLLRRVGGGWHIAAAGSTQKASALLCGRPGSPGIPDTSPFAGLSILV